MYVALVLYEHLLGIDKFSKNLLSESSILGLRIKFITKGSLYYSKGQKNY